MAGVVFGAMLAAAVTVNLAREDGMKGSTATGMVVVESPSLRLPRSVDLSIWQVGAHGEALAVSPANSPEVLRDLFIDAGVTAPTPAAPVSDRTVEPTAVAAASPPLPTANGCPDVIIEVFGPNAPAACAVAWCESRWQPDATGAAGERGLFQVHPYWHYDSTYDPLGNTLAAYRISSGGVDWSAWTCKPW